MSLSMNCGADANLASCRSLTAPNRAKNKVRNAHQALQRLYWHANLRVYLSLISCFAAALVVLRFALRVGQLVLNGADGFRNAETFLTCLAAFFTATCLVLYRRERQSLDKIEQRMADQLSPSSQQQVKRISLQLGYGPDAANQGAVPGKRRLP